MILTIAFEGKVFRGGMAGVNSGPNFTTNMPQPLNEDITIGDFMFYTPLTPNGGFGTAELSDLVRIGEIVDIREQIINVNNQQLHTFNEGANAYQDQLFKTEIDVEWDNVNIASPGVDDFFLFSKIKYC